jgi:hypothetical protein
MRHLLVILALIAAIATPVAAHAQAENLSGDVDLILPPVLASSDAPFYRGASVKVGDVVMPVKEAATTNGQLVQFQPENKQVVISNAAGVSENEKGAALLDVVTAMQASAIATAAGQ